MLYKIYISKKIIEKHTSKDLQNTYKFSKIHDYKNKNDNFNMEI